MKCKIIVARDRASGIGRFGTIPWNITADLKRFSQLTRSHNVVMGRHTWASLPASYKPLPGRNNIVVGQPRNLLDFAWRQNGNPHDGVESLAQAYRTCLGTGQDMWIIGGARMYEEGLVYADELHVTEVDDVFGCDTFFPEIPPCFVLQSRERHTQLVGPAFSFDHYVRRR